MSDVITSQSDMPSGPPEVPEPPVRVTPPRNYLARLLLDTFGRRGARVGLAWLLVVCFCSVFAPFLASSHPILVKIDNQWSSPLLKHLTPVDVSLLIGTFIGLVLYRMRSIVPKRRWGIFAGLMLVLSVLSSILVSPPKTVVYETYRVLEAEGKVQWILRAPIPYSPSDRMRDQTDLEHPVAPQSELSFWMGTERNGADVFSRMIHASRIAMSIGFISTGIALVIGVTIGGLMGYFSSIVDILGMRLVEVFAAIPTLYLLLAFAAFFPRNLYIMMAIIGCTSWVGYATFVRAEFLKLRQQDFVQAARASGLPLRSILFKHMLPNGITPVLVSASFGVAGAILAEATLSFLGLGLVDEPSWGQMLNQAISAGGFSWWLAIYPGLAIFFTVFGYNLIGEALRDALDPHTRKAAQL